MVVSAFSTAEEQIDNSNSIQETESNPNGFFWRNDNGVLVQTEYEFCL